MRTALAALGWYGFGRRDRSGRTGRNGPAFDVHGGGSEMERCGVARKTAVAGAGEAIDVLEEREPRFDRRAAGHQQRVAPDLPARGRRPAPMPPPHDAVADAARLRRRGPILAGALALSQVVMDSRFRGKDRRRHGRTGQAIHAFAFTPVEDVDGRDKHGHDEFKFGCAPRIRHAREA